MLVHTVLQFLNQLVQFKTTQLKKANITWQPPIYVARLQALSYFPSQMRLPSSLLEFILEQFEERAIEIQDNYDLDLTLNPYAENLFWIEFSEALAKEVEKTSFQILFPHVIRGVDPELLELHSQCDDFRGFFLDEYDIELRRVRGLYEQLQKGPFCTYVGEKNRLYAPLSLKEMYRIRAKQGDLSFTENDIQNRPQIYKSFYDFLHQNYIPTWGKKNNHIKQFFFPLAEIVYAFFVQVNYDLFTPEEQEACKYSRSLKEALSALSRLLKNCKIKDVNALYGQRLLVNNRNYYFIDILLDLYQGVQNNFDIEDMYEAMLTMGKWIDTHDELIVSQFPGFKEVLSDQPISMESVERIYELINESLAPRRISPLQLYNAKEMITAEKAYLTFWKYYKSLQNKIEQKKLDTQQIRSGASIVSLRRVLKRVRQDACIEVQGEVMIPLVMNYAPWLRFKPHIESRFSHELKEWRKGPFRVTNDFDYLTQEEALRRLLILTSAIFSSTQLQSMWNRNKIKLWDLEVSCASKEVHQMLTSYLIPMLENNECEDARSIYAKIILTIVKPALLDTSIFTWFNRPQGIHKWLLSIDDGSLFEHYLWYPSEEIAAVIYANLSEVRMQEFLTQILEVELQSKPYYLKELRINVQFVQWLNNISAQQKANLLISLRNQDESLEKLIENWLKFKTKLIESKLKDNPLLLKYYIQNLENLIVGSQVRESILEQDHDRPILQSCC